MMAARETLNEAILWHGGEAETSKQNYSRDDSERKRCAYRLLEITVIRQAKSK